METPGCRCAALLNALKANIHTGDTYAALVVRRSFKPAKKTQVLQEDEVDVIAKIKKPGERRSEKRKQED